MLAQPPRLVIRTPADADDALAMLVWLVPMMLPHVVVADDQKNKARRLMPMMLGWFG